MRNLWFQYSSLGGNAGEVEVDAYLHQCLVLPAFQRDLLAHSANELIALQPPLRAPYTSDLLEDPDPATDKWATRVAEQVLHARSGNEVCARKGH